MSKGILFGFIFTQFIACASVKQSPYDEKLSNDHHLTIQSKSTFENGMAANSTKLESEFSLLAPRRIQAGVHALHVDSQASHYSYVGPSLSFNHSNGALSLLSMGKLRSEPDDSVPPVSGKLSAKFYSTGINFLMVQYEHNELLAWSPELVKRGRHRKNWTLYAEHFFANKRAELVVSANRGSQHEGRLSQNLGDLTEVDLRLGAGSARWSTRAGIYSLLQTWKARQIESEGLFPKGGYLLGAYLSGALQSWRRIFYFRYLFKYGLGNASSEIARNFSSEQILDVDMTKSLSFRFGHSSYFSESKDKFKNYNYSLWLGLRGVI